MVISPNPLEAFVEWILNDLSQQYDTVAFSHFVGRFDMVLVFKELFLRGKILFFKEKEIFLRIYA